MQELGATATNCTWIPASPRVRDGIRAPRSQQGRGNDWRRSDTPESGGPHGLCALTLMKRKENWLYKR